MNPTEQQQRRDALREARGELHKEYASFEARVRNELSAQEARHVKDVQRLRDELKVRQGEAVAASATLTERLTRILRSDWLSRWVWLLFGKDISVGSVKKYNARSQPNDNPLDKEKNTRA